jgi:tRNA (guanine10-N2)-methyltransferase
LWSNQPNREALHKDIQKQIHTAYSTASFKFNVVAYNRHFTNKQQVDIIEEFQYLPFQGPIDLKNPNVTLCYYEDYGPLPLKDSKMPLEVYFGVFVAHGNRSAANIFDLRHREYLGTTSMDPLLSLVMANMALARPGSLILDPFVGTGSFLLCCSHFGAFTMGSDIDGRQIRGKSAYIPQLKEKIQQETSVLPKEPESVKRSAEKIKSNCVKSLADNVEQYHLQSKVLGTLVCDIAHHPWRNTEFWDAIVCDPPYGIRAGAKKIGKKTQEIEMPPVKKNGEMRYPQTVDYRMDEVIIDLMQFAATYLNPGGRLVFWLPTVTEEYSVTDIPTHPQLDLVANSEQNFGKWSRRLITMEKKNVPMAEIQIPENHVPAHAKFREVYFAPKK